MTGTEMENKIRRQLRQNAGRFDHNRIIEEINAGLYDFCAETFALTKVITYSVEKFKRDYDFPDDFLDIRNIFYNLKPLRFRSQQEMKDLFARQGAMARIGTPGIYYQPLHGKFALFPIPDTERTTAIMVSSISEGRVSFVVDSTSGFNSIGEFLVSDSGEVIAYFNLTSIEFGGIVRAQEETSGETVASAVSLRERDLKMDYYALDLGFIPDTMNNVPQLSKEYHNAIVDYAMWQLLNELPDNVSARLSQKYEANYLRVRREAKGNIKTQQRSRLPRVRDVAFGTSID